MKNYQFIPINELPKTYKKTKNQELLEAFVDSGIEICELKLEPGTKLNAGNLKVSARRFSLPVDVFSRNSKIYLVRRHV